ncbi:MAG: peptidoglycan-associated lipoprotein Pal [Pseudomonadales bacterium]
MIASKPAKLSAALLFAAFLVTGCSSTSTTDGGGDSTSSGDTAYDSTAQGQAYGSDNVDSSTSGQDAAGRIGTIFYFDFDKSELRGDVRAKLNEQARLLNGKSGIVRLEGHADERGTREYNIALGERRAMAVANYLASQGVARSQIETISYGEEKPQALGHDDSAWSQNRRVGLSYSE